MHIQIEGASRAHCFWDALRLNAGATSTDAAAVNDGADSQTTITGTGRSIN